MTGDEPQETMGRVQTAGEAPSRPLSPSRLPLRAHRRETSGYEAGSSPSFEAKLGKFSGRSWGGCRLGGRFIIPHNVSKNSQILRIPLKFAFLTIFGCK